MRGYLPVPFNSAVSRILGKSFRSAAFMAAALLILISPRELPAQDDAQDDIPIPVPHKPIAPRVNTTAFANEPKELRSMVGGPWMLDPNMKSTLYLRNSMETESVAATPVLYLSNGKKIILPSVNIKPASTATVSIGDALLEQGIAPYADLKGYAEISYVSSFDPLCATVVSVDTVHSVIFTYSFRPTAPAAITLKALGRPIPDRNANLDQKIDGLWWKQKASVTGFVSLSNTTNTELQVQLDVSGGTGQQLASHEVSITPHATEIIDLSEIASVPASAGGIEISYSAPPEAVLISGGLQDIATGYSATMAFRPSSMLEKQAAGHTVTLTELGLMNGMQDPMMLFSGGTQFTPFSVLRNVSAKPASLVPELFWMERGSTQRKRLSTMTLAPSQALVLDMPSLLKQAGMEGFNGVFNLTFRTKAPDNALLLASGSVDQTGTYVFQVLPHEVRESMAKTISYWSTANGDDTMVTVWNPADEAQDLLFTIQYEGGSYVLPLHLEARATRLFNISSIIQDQLPDAYGHVIPATVTSGSARIAGTHADNERILVEIDSGIYNVNKATCIYSCTSCDGALNALIGEPVNFSLGTQHQLSFLLQQNTGGTYDYSAEGSWSSSNTSVATVASQGMASSVSAGNFTGSSYIEDVPIYNSDYCAYNVSCPDEGYMSGSGGGTVNNYGLTVTGSTPVTFGGSGPITITGTGFQHAGFSNPSVTIPGLTVSNVSVLSATTMTATYQSSCQASVGSSPNGLTLQFTYDGTTPTASGPYSIVLPNIPPPTIQFNGATISGTQSAVVGQQIALSAVAPTLPNCVTFYNPNTGAQSFAPQWGTPSGTAIGGYSASSASAKVTPLSTATTGTSYSFYWPYAGNSYQETVKYYYAAWSYGGWSPSATATFNIQGGGSMSTAALNYLTLSSLPPCGGGTASPAMVYGVPGSGSTICSFSASSTFGVRFTPSGAPSGGTYSYVQLINSDNRTENTISCSTTQGVDTAYPYGGIYPGTQPPQAVDAPGVPLPTNYKVNRVFSASMFLLWKSNISGSIAVPIGYQSWGFNGTATPSGNTFTISTSGTPGLNGGFITSSGSQTSDGYTALQSGYPIWNNVATESCN